MNDKTKKPNFTKEIDEIKTEFTKMGDIGRKLSGVNDNGVKAEIVRKHKYDLNDIKKKIKTLKLSILEAKDSSAHAKLLTWERQRLLISIPDEYILNKMESETLEETCECHNNGIHHVELGANYKHRSYFDEARGKDMCVVYIPIVKAPEEQIGKELSWKMSQGFMPQMKDYPEPKTLVIRRVLVESEFKRYFREI